MTFTMSYLQSQAPLHYKGKSVWNKEKKQKKCVLFQGPPKSDQEKSNQKDFYIYSLQKFFVIPIIPSMVQLLSNDCSAGVNHKPCFLVNSLPLQFLSFSKHQVAFYFPTILTCSNPKSTVL